MIKTTALTLLFGLLSYSLSAQHGVTDCAASPDPITINNGGQPLTIIGRGNARQSWTETIDGYLLKQNKAFVYEYVIQDKAGKLVLSGVKAGNSIPATKASAKPVRANATMIKKITAAKPFGIESISAITATEAAGIAPFTTTAMPTTGSIRVLCLLVDYPDLGQKYSRTDLENLLNQADFGGTGSFKDYFTNASFGKLDVTVDVINWVTAPNNYEYYGRVNGYGRARELVRFAIDQAEANGVDFSIYDNDNDGDVDGIMVVHAGQGAEEGSRIEYIWSHRSSIPGVTYDGKVIRDYIINPETRASGSIATIGVYCHEFGHNLGLPDLYDTDGSSQGIGNWGLMGSASWLGGGKKPGGLSAWSKIKLGWQVPQEITANGTYTLNPAATNEEILLIYPGENKEYFLLENRQKVGVDNSLPGAGLAIWHIDDSRYSNANEDHKRVDLEEADGLNGLDGSSRGDGGDLYPGTSGNDTFNASSNPNNQLYNGSPGIARLLNITQNADSTITLTADLDNVRFVPQDTITFPATATGKTKEKSFGLKAFNYDFIITDVTYPDGFTGNLRTGDTIAVGTAGKYTLVFVPLVAKTYKGSIAIAGTSNGNTITGTVPVKGVALQTLFADDFSSDTGWTLAGFERGAPQGLGGDPDSAFVGPNVLGTVLAGSGQYSNNLSDRQWVAVSPVFSCYGYNDIQLVYQQWLNLSSYNQDYAYLDVSIDGGATWKEVIRYGDWEINQNYWWNVMRDLSEYVAWQENVQLRFALGPTNATGAHGGWNIDDLIITGKADTFQLTANYDFGPTGIGVNKSRQFTLKNGTGNNFSITALTLPAGYTSNLAPGDVVPAGSSKTFTVTLTPLAVTPYTGTFELTFTDGSQTYAVAEPLAGEGVYLIFTDDFETNKGWQLTGDFTIGVPLGRGADPPAAFSGSKVLGTVLGGSGQYVNNLTDRQWTATSPVIDCSTFTGVKLNFARFNQIDGYADSAYVDISTDAGVSWNQVWSTEGRWVGDWQWTRQTLDISALADGKQEVMVRFALGATDSAWVNAGWNIDDVTIYGTTAVAIYVTEQLDYNNVLVGNSAGKNIEITNVGVQDLVVSGIAYPAGFTGENFSGTLTSGATKTIPVTFAPAAPRVYQDTLQIISNAATGNDKVILTGTGTGAKLRANYVSDLGEVFVDSLATTTVYLVNEGNTDLLITGVAHSATVFSGSWTGTIAAGDSTALTVSFVPAAAQVYTNTITITGNAIDGDETILITGKGVLTVREGIFNPGTLAFGQVQVDSTRTASTYLKNTGNDVLSVTEITHTNNAFAGSWNGTIAPGDSVLLNLRFTPVSNGVLTDTLKVLSNATTGQAKAILTGTGVPNYSKLFLVTDNYDFGEVRVDTLVQQLLSVANKGNIPLNITAVDIGNNAFAVDWQTGTIAAGDSAVLAVSFQPPERLDYAATLSFISDADSGSFTLDLTGKGVAGLIALNGAVNFGEVEVGQVRTDTITIANTGDASFEVAGVAFSDTAFASDWSGVVAAGATERVAVSFSPGAARDYAAVLTVVHNALAGTDTLALTGTGIDIIAGLGDENGELGVYPNPTSGRLYLQNPGKQPFTYFVLDRTGKQVLTGTAVRELNLNGLAAGLYTIRLTQPTRTRVFKVLIKK